MTDSRPTSPWFAERQARARDGDSILLVTNDNKRYLIKLKPGGRLHTHKGIYEHEQLVGARYGDTVDSQLGQSALLLEPGLGDLMTHVRRGTQIIYPKDAAWIVHRLGLRAGSTVIEAGTGSGSLTTALAWAVAPTGRVYTYEGREEIFEIARRNLDRVNLLPFVEMTQRVIGSAEEAGFDQTHVDALFLDVREPWHFLPHVRAALRAGGCFAALLPTANQVSELLAGLEANGFVDIAVEELLLRPYKPVPDRLRPADEMTAHTGYLTFARPLLHADDATRWLSRDRKRYRAREEAKRRQAKREAEREASGEDGQKYPKLPLP